MNILLAITLLLPQAIEIQTDWVSGPGTFGPVGTWGSAFYQSDSINYNISGQISLVSTTIPGGWTKHIIQTNTQIRGQDGIYPVDFDDDGDLDLAAWWGGTSSDNKVRIYRNQKVETGIADFTIQNDLALPNGSTYYGILWCGDFDNDGDADIVVPCSPGPWWFENIGSFNFTPYTIGSIVYNRSSCDVGDVDNDGDKDIVIIGVLGNSGTPGPLDLWRNDGAMNFTWQNITSNGNWWRVMLGDLNNDNYLDIFNSGNVYLNSSGNYPGTPSWTVPYADDVDGIWIRDFNNDGKKDLLIGFQWASIPEMAWFENDGSGISYTKHTICTGDTAFQHADACIGEDIDLDGMTDVVGTYQRVGFFRQIAANSFELNGDVAGTYQQDDYFGQIMPTSFELNEIDTINDSHWAFVANLDYMPGGNDIDLDILVSSVDTFAWYENIAAGIQYADSGFLTSSILEKLDATSWQKLHWTGSCPTGTYLVLWVRSGSDTASIQTNAWQGPFVVLPGQPSGEFDISGVTTPGHHYFQYKVFMATNTFKDLSPVIYELAVEYEVIPVIPDPWPGTIYTHGYWKNHPDSFAEYLPVTIAGVTVSTVNQALTILRNPSARIAWNSFLCHFLTTKFNTCFDSTLLNAFYNDTAKIGEFMENQPVGSIIIIADNYLETTPRETLLLMKDVFDATNNHLKYGVLWQGPYPIDGQVYTINPDDVQSYSEKIPLSFGLAKPYPNPTNKQLSLCFSIPYGIQLELLIYDINGRAVKKLISETKGPGIYRINTDCQELGSGVYIVKMKADKFEARTKFIVTN